MPTRCPRKGREAQKDSENQALLLLLLCPLSQAASPPHTHPPPRQGTVDLLAAVFQIPESREAVGALLMAPRYMFLARPQMPARGSISAWESRASTCECLLSSS